MVISKTPRKGAKLIEEAARLLCRMPFSTERGGTARGEHVHVIADPRWDEAGKTFRLSVICYAPGFRVDWAGLPIVVEPVDEHNRIAYVTRLDQGGQATLPVLPSGQYRFFASALWLESREPVVYPLAKGDVPEKLAAARRPAPEEWPELPESIASQDERLLVTSQQEENGQFILTAETKHEEFAGSRVQFFFVDSLDQIRFVADAGLSKAGERPLWVGRWKGRLELDEPCRIICQVVPDE